MNYLSIGIVAIWLYWLIYILDKKTYKQEAEIRNLKQKIEELESKLKSKKKKII